jgi:hypothetical protein
LLGLVRDALEATQDGCVALPVIDLDDICQCDRVEDFDEPTVGETALVCCSREGAKSAKHLRVG